MLARFYKVISAHYWADLASLLYESMSFFLYGYILLGEVNFFPLLMTEQFWIEAKEEYQNSLIFVILSFLLCAHRGIQLSSVAYKQPKTDSEAVYSIYKIIELCTSKGKGSIVALTVLLNKHTNHCSDYKCECRKLLAHLKKYNQDPIRQNFTVYKSSEKVPHYINNSWRAKVLSILLNRISKKFNKSEEVQWLTAQVMYLYLGNHYHSLSLLSNIEANKPGLILRLQLYNFRQIIGAGMLKESIDGQTYVLDSLEYQKYYRKFLDVAEEIAELTIKFWFTLSKEVPDNSILNTIGISLFSLRKRLKSIVEKINKISANNVEFLVKYGVYMKLVVHDAFAASTSFNQIMRSINRRDQNNIDEGTFSTLRGDMKNMMITISLETADFMNMTDANSEAEKILCCTRGDLIGKSLGNIMPPMIADAHKTYMQKFFKSMHYKMLNGKHVLFVKNKTGIYTICTAIKSIVPRLTGGFQGVMFAHRNKRVPSYTKAKKEVTSKNVFLI
eukprot:TRINITY_DN2481_c0_g2_i2.p1 TRINITY_DN2481_c0_g2~~TRINITY_DN2481_c0_g2_i2.p1  ORF type:complete len:502 (-),score=36.98 TRINITY_DN2481_c0_g2_i2:2948-4453(-)